MKLSTSILSIKDDIDIKENIKKLIDYKIDYLHLDIMDGEFVTNKTWNIDDIKKILPGDLNNLDVHLMVYDLERYINDFAILNPQYITFHLEATNCPQKYINLIKQKNIKVGISVKPNTDLNSLKPILKDVDLVLIMSVEPGYGKQKFLNSAIERIDTLYKWREESNYSYVIEIDGGINKDTIDYCRKCDIVVVGSYITSNDYETSIKSLNL